MVIDRLVVICTSQIGVSTGNNTISYITGPYGDLSTILDVGDTMPLTQSIRFSFAYDVAAGMIWLHERDIIHANLKTPCCYIDSNWTVKISDWSYSTIYSLQADFRQAEDVLREELEEDEMEKWVGIIFLSRKRISSPQIHPLAFLDLPGTHRRRFRRPPSHAGQAERRLQLRDCPLPDIHSQKTLLPHASRAHSLRSSTPCHPGLSAVGRDTGSD